MTPTRNLYSLAELLVHLLQSISGCLSHSRNMKIQTDQSNASYSKTFTEYSEFDWSVCFFVFPQWDKQPEIDCGQLQEMLRVY